MALTFPTIPKTLLSTLVIGIVCAVPMRALSAEDEASSITEAFEKGDASISFRLRYEDVDQEGTEPASATTLKTRITYTTAAYHGWALTTEMDDTTELFDADYTDGVTGRGTAAIADPEVTEVNQAFISYTTGATTAKWGRQRILLDNQRFVGGVGWRQDEQTYSGFTLSSKPVDGLSLFYGYITEVNRIFAEAGDHNHDTHLINVKYGTTFGSIIGYGYMIDNQTALALGSDTMGLRWEGKIGKTFSYNLEYATQSEGGDNPNDYEADYMLAEVMGAIPIGSNKLKLKLGHEVLGSDDGTQGFTTSLATLHKFQGWADKFLGTPANGVADTYASIGSNIGNVTLGLEYHSLASDFDDIDYGTEIDFIAKTKVGPLGLLLKYSDYSADDFATDTQKIWLMTSVTF